MRCPTAESGVSHAQSAITQNDKNTHMLESRSVRLISIVRRVSRGIHERAEDRVTCKRCIPIVAIRWLSSLINRSKVTISITIGIRIKLNCQPKRYNTISGAMPMMTMHVDEHAQSVSQLFHGPAPRSPLHRLSIRLRRSRSNTSTEYSLPGATQLSQVRSISPSGLCELPEHETPADPRHFGRSAPRGGGGLCVRPLSTTPTPSHSLTR